MRHAMWFFCLLMLMLPLRLHAAGAEPRWLNETITEQGGYIYTVGRSKPQVDEQLSRSEAFSNALQAFVKYCKTNVDSFDKTVETQSKNKKKTSSSLDVTSQNAVFAKASVSGAVPQEWHIVSENGKYTAAVLIKVPKSEFERISKPGTNKTSLDVFFYCEDAGGRMQMLSDGCILKSGDGYAVYVKPDNPCYLYVYQLDGLGKAFKLFPNGSWKTGTNPLPAGEGLWIPNNNELFVLDETTGKEYFYIFASQDKIDEFEGENPDNLTKKDIDSLIKIKKMGVARLKDKKDKYRAAPPKHPQADIVEIKKKLQAEGDFVYETWFWHR